MIPRRKRRLTLDEALDIRDELDAASVPCRVVRLRDGAIVTFRYDHELYLVQTMAYWRRIRRRVTKEP